MGLWLLNQILFDRFKGFLLWNHARIPQIWLWFYTSNSFEPKLKGHKGRISEALPKSRYRSRSRSPRRRYRDDYRDRDYRRRSRSRSWDRYDRDRYYGRDRDYRRRSRSRSASPDYYRGGGRGRYDDERWSLTPYKSRSRSRSPYQSIDSASPARCSPIPRKSPSPLSRSCSANSDSLDGQSPTSRSVSPRHRPADSRSPSPRNSDFDD